MSGVTAEQLGAAIGNAVAAMTARTEELAESIEGDLRSADRHINDHRIESLELRNRVAALELKVSGLVDDLNHQTTEQERRTEDVRNDLESNIDRVRSDVSALEHKVDYS